MGRVSRAIRCLIACLPAAVLAVASAAPPSTCLAEERREVTITGGPIFEAWPSTDSAVACAILVDAPTVADERRRPVHVALVVDLSSAMAGEPLEAVKKCAKVVVNSLADGDHLGVVTFSDFAQCPFAMRPLNSATRATAASTIDGLREEHGRDISAGLDKAIIEFERFKGQSVAGRHVLLVTAGNPTKGVHKPTELVARTGELADRYAFSISVFAVSTFGTFGVKEDFSEDLLQEIALSNGGRYHFIEEPSDAERIASSEADRIARATARQVVLAVTTQNEAKISRVLGAVQEGSRLKVGDMRAGVRQLVVFDLVRRPERERDLVVNVEWVEPGGFTTRRTREYLSVPLTSGAARLSTSMGQYLVVVDLQEDLARTAGEIGKGRRDYVTMFRNRLTQLEQDNASLNSDYLREQLAYYRAFGRNLDNTAIANEQIAKHIKYRLLRLLYGE